MSDLSEIDEAVMIIADKLKRQFKAAASVIACILSLAIVYACGFLAIHLITNGFDRSLLTVVAVFCLFVSAITFSTVVIWLLGKAIEIFDRKANSVVFVIRGVRARVITLKFFSRDLDRKRLIKERREAQDRDNYIKLKKWSEYDSGGETPPDPVSLFEIPQEECESLRNVRKTESVSKLL